MSEPSICINGKSLTEGEAMTVRVALTCYMLELQSRDALGSDEHGRAMVEAYKVNGVRVLAKMLPLPPTP